MDEYQRACLEAMEIPVWVSRSGQAQSETIQDVVKNTAVENIAEEKTTQQVGEQSIPAVDKVNEALQETDHPVLTEEKAPQVSSTPPVGKEKILTHDEIIALKSELFSIEESLDEAIPASATVSQLHLGWEALQQKVQHCTQCLELVNNRTRTVFGTGDMQARLMIIGEAPGADEDRQGEPFVGKAGQLLNRMIEAMGLKRQQVYIANVLKCRPPDNRDPKPHEIIDCSGFLQRQISLVSPDVIMIVGRIAAQSLLKTTTPISKLRGSVVEIEGIKTVITYHPAYLLRSPQEKAKAWHDLKIVISLLKIDQ